MAPATVHQPLLGCINRAGAGGTARRAQPAWLHHRPPPVPRTDCRPGAARGGWVAADRAPLAATSELRLLVRHGGSAVSAWPGVAARSTSRCPPAHAWRRGGRPPSPCCRVPKARLTVPLAIRELTAWKRALRKRALRGSVQACKRPSRGDERAADMPPPRRLSPESVWSRNALAEAFREAGVLKAEQHVQRVHRCGGRPHAPRTPPRPPPHARARPPAPAPRRAAPPRPAVRCCATQTWRGAPSPTSRAPRRRR